MQIQFGRRSKSISGKSGQRQSPGCMILFGLIFLLAGGAVTFFMTVVPLYKWQAAQDWEATSCTITQSMVDSQSDEDGTTYKAVIHFKYNYQGRDYSGGSYNFNTAYSSGQSGKQAIVSRYPVGSESTCYVNPADPSEAVLSRDFSWTYLFGLFGLIFVLVGGGISFAGLRGSKGEKSISARGKLKRVPIVSEYSQGPVTLKSAHNHILQIFFILLIPTIFNGATILMISKKINGEDVPVVLIVGFCVASIFTLCLAVYNFLKLFNPHPILTLEKSAIPLGGTATMTWTFEGSVNRLNNLKIWVQGREEATYRQGTDTHTDKNVFEKIPILETSHTPDMRTGKVHFTIPEFTMHSFASSNNKIIWTLHVHGDIPKWPDVKEEFPITVTALQREE